MNDCSDGRNYFHSVNVDFVASKFELKCFFENFLLRQDHQRKNILVQSGFFQKSYFT
jgi:hypothetical protein